MNQIRAVLMLAGLAALAACTTVPQRTSEGVTGESGRRALPKPTLDCIFVRSLYDWKALDDYNLVVWAPSRHRPYHVELNLRCNGLRFADAIAFSDRGDGRICSGDAIIVGRTLPQRCTIGAIHPVAGEELGLLMSDFGFGVEEADSAGEESASGESQEEERE